MPSTSVKSTLLPVMKSYRTVPINLAHVKYQTVDQQNEKNDRDVHLMNDTRGVDLPDTDI